MNICNNKIYMEIIIEVIVILTIIELNKKFNSNNKCRIQIIKWKINKEFKIKI